MARSKTVKTYPIQFMEMLEALHEDPSKYFDVPFETMKEAKNFMLTVHAFRSAALREELTSMYPEVMAMYVCLLKDQIGVRVMHRDYSPEALAMGKALNLAKEKKAVEDADKLSE